MSANIKPSNNNNNSDVPAGRYALSMLRIIIA